MFAYLDPGSGGLIAATAAAGLAGVGVVARTKWQQAKGRLGFNRGAADEGEADAEPTDAVDADSTD